MSSSSSAEFDAQLAELIRRRAQLPFIAHAWNNLSPSDTRQIAVAIGRPHLASGRNWLFLSSADRELVVLAFRRAVVLGQICAQAIRDESRLQQQGKPTT